MKAYVKLKKTCEVDSKVVGRRMVVKNFKLLSLNEEELKEVSESSDFEIKEYLSRTEKHKKAKKESKKKEEN